MAKNISDEHKDKIRRFPEGKSEISEAEKQRMAAEELLEDMKNGYPLFPVDDTTKLIKEIVDSVRGVDDVDDVKDDE